MYAEICWSSDHSGWGRCQDPVTSYALWPNRPTSDPHHVVGFCAKHVISLCPPGREMSYSEALVFETMTT